MLDIGWSEMAVIALVALVIIGPKDLPRVMRTMGHWVRKARSVSREFQSSIDEMIREAELEDAKKAIQSTKNFNLDRALEETVDPTGDLKKEVRAVDAAARDEEASKAETAGGGKPKVDKDKPETPAGATVIKHPVQPAPPHSIAPPKEPSSSEVAAAPSGEEASSSASGQKSA